MFQMYFTEQPMNAYPREEKERYGYTATIFPNKFFDPKEGSRLYNERLMEFAYAEEMGFEGLMLNEHHNAPFCMSPRINIMAAAVAAITEKAKLVLLGNPVPLADNPVLMAEELAMLDLISKGRIVSGLIRGAGQEMISANVNPAYNRERFEEGHDLIIKTFTTPGPWRWEGNHYHMRVVNPWVRVLQQPHPRIWIPGTLSAETIQFAASHRYPYLALNPSMDDANRIWNLYDQTAARVGYKSGPENRGYLIRCHVQDTDEKAEENAREFMWMEGEFLGLTNSDWQRTPSGYSSPAGRRQRLQAPKRIVPPYEEQLKSFMIVAGSPQTVIKKMKNILESCSPSIISYWANDGGINHKDSLNCIKLLGQEVVPAVQEYGDKLGLKSPFEANTPVSLQFTPASELHPAPAAATAHR